MVRFATYFSAAMDGKTTLTITLYRGSMAPKIKLLLLSLTLSLSLLIVGNGAARAQTTYYSYINGGNWDESIWTTNPSGLVLRPAPHGAGVPGNGSTVVILPGANPVSLNADVNTENLTIEVRAGATLILGEHKFTKPIKALKGRGTISVAGDHFPELSATGKHTFLESGGGTIRFEKKATSAEDIEITTIPLTLGSLEFAGEKVSYYLNYQTPYHSDPTSAAAHTNEMRILGNLTVSGKGVTLYVDGAKDEDAKAWKGASNTIRRKDLTIRGDLLVKEGAEFTIQQNKTCEATGNATTGMDYYKQHTHMLTLYGNLRNEGTVDLHASERYDLSAPLMWQTMTMLSAGRQDSKMACFGTTRLRYLLLDKASDLNKLQIYADLQSRFQLLGDNTTKNKSLYLNHGKLQISDNVAVLSLSENGAFELGPNATLEVNGQNALVMGVAPAATAIKAIYNDQNLTVIENTTPAKGYKGGIKLNGRLEVQNGVLNMQQSGGIYSEGEKGGALSVSGGVLLSTRILSRTPVNPRDVVGIMYRQTGGVVVLIGNNPHALVTTEEIMAPEKVQWPVGTGWDILKGSHIGDKELNLDEQAEFALVGTADVLVLQGGELRLVPGQSDQALRTLFRCWSTPNNTGATGGEITVSKEYLNGTNPTTLPFNIDSRTSIYSLKCDLPAGQILEYTNSTPGGAQPFTAMGSITIENGTLQPKGDANLCVQQDLTIAESLDAKLLNTNTLSFTGSTPSRFTYPGQTRPATDRKITTVLINKNDPVDSVVYTGGTLEIVKELEVEGTTLQLKGSSSNITFKTSSAQIVLKQGGQILSDRDNAQLILDGVTGIALDANGGIIDRLTLKSGSASTLLSDLEIGKTLTFEPGAVSTLDIQDYKLTTHFEGRTSPFVNSGFGTCTGGYILTRGESGDDGVEVKLGNVESSATLSIPFGVETSSSTAVPKTYKSRQLTFDFGMNPQCANEFMRIVYVNSRHLLIKETSSSNDTWPFYYRFFTEESANSKFNTIQVITDFLSQTATPAACLEDAASSPNTGAALKSSSAPFMHFGEKKIGTLTPTPIKDKIIFPAITGESGYIWEQQDNITASGDNYGFSIKGPFNGDYTRVSDKSKVQNPRIFIPIGYFFNVKYNGWYGSPFDTNELSRDRNLFPEINQLKIGSHFKNGNYERGSQYNYAYFFVAEWDGSQWMEKPYLYNHTKGEEISEENWVNRLLPTPQDVLIIPKGYYFWIAYGTQIVPNPNETTTKHASGYMAAAILEIKGDGKTENTSIPPSGILDMALSVYRSEVGRVKGGGVLAQASPVSDVSATGYTFGIPRSNGVKTDISEFVSNRGTFLVYATVRFPNTAFYTPSGVRKYGNLFLLFRAGINEPAYLLFNPNEKRVDVMGDLIIATGRDNYINIENKISKYYSSMNDPRGSSGKSEALERLHVRGNFYLKGSPTFLFCGGKASSGADLTSSQMLQVDGNFGIVDFVNYQKDAISANQKSQARIFAVPDYSSIPTSNTAYSDKTPAVAEARSSHDKLIIGGDLINLSELSGIILSSRILETNTDLPYNTVDITFTGKRDSKIVVGGSTPIRPYTLTLDKGDSQKYSLTIENDGNEGSFQVLRTPEVKFGATNEPAVKSDWLNIKNGTLIVNTNRVAYEYGASPSYTGSIASGILPINYSYGFELPATGALVVDNEDVTVDFGRAPDFTATPVLIAGKVYLKNGKITLGQESAYVDLEYSGSGTAQLQLEKGDVIHYGSLRQNSVTKLGALNYEQSGANYRIIPPTSTERGSTERRNGDFEILDGDLNLSGGTINVELQEPNDSPYGDINIRPQGNVSVTGVTMNVYPRTSTISNSKIFNLTSTSPLYNLVVGNESNGDLTLAVKDADLDIKGDLTLFQESEFKSDGRDITLRKNLLAGQSSTSGTPLKTAGGHLLMKNNTFTFDSGEEQKLEGGVEREFHNLVMRNNTKLTQAGPIKVNSNLVLETRNGILDNQANIELKGDVTNNSQITYTSTPASSGAAPQDHEGLMFVGDAGRSQYIKGNGIFGRILIDNPDNVVATENFSMTDRLGFQNGKLDIGENLLIMSNTAYVDQDAKSPSHTSYVQTSAIKMSAGMRYDLEGRAVSKDVNKHFNQLVYPLGTSTDYTPSKLTLEDGTYGGSIRIKNLSTPLPVENREEVLQYNWNVESNGLTIGGTPSPSPNAIALEFKAPNTFWTGKSAWGNAGRTGTVKDYALRFNPDMSPALIKEADKATTTESSFEEGVVINYDLPIQNSSITGRYSAGPEETDVNLRTVESINNGAFLGDPDKEVWKDTKSGEKLNFPEGKSTENVTFIIHKRHTITIAEGNVQAGAIQFPDDTGNDLKKRGRLVVENPANVDLGDVSGTGAIVLKGGVMPNGNYDKFLSCENKGLLIYSGDSNSDYRIVASWPKQEVPYIWFTDEGTRRSPSVSEYTVCNQMWMGNSVTYDNDSETGVKLLGTIGRETTAKFKAGSQKTAYVKFASSSMTQSFGGQAPSPLPTGESAKDYGDFTDDNAFNNVIIENDHNVEVRSEGNIDVKGELILNKGELVTRHNDGVANLRLILQTAYDQTGRPELLGQASSFVRGPIHIKRTPQSNVSTFYPPIGVSSDDLGNYIQFTDIAVDKELTVEYFHKPNHFTQKENDISFVTPNKFWNITSNESANAKIGIDKDKSFFKEGSTKASDLRIGEYKSGDASTVTTGKWAAEESEYVNGSIRTQQAVTFNRDAATNVISYTLLSRQQEAKPFIWLAALNSGCSTEGDKAKVQAFIGGSGFDPADPNVSITVRFTDNNGIQTDKELSDISDLTNMSFDFDFSLANQKFVKAQVTAWSYRSSSGSQKSGPIDQTQEVKIGRTPTLRVEAGIQRQNSPYKICGDNGGIQLIASTSKASNPLPANGTWKWGGQGGGHVLDPQKATTKFLNYRNGDYTITYETENEGCKASAQLQIISLQPPELNVIVPSPFCKAGEIRSIELSTDTNLGNKYNWKISGSSLHWDGNGGQDRKSEQSAEKLFLKKGYDLGEYTLTVTATYTTCPLPNGSAFTRTVEAPVYVGYTPVGELDPSSESICPVLDANANSSVTATQTYIFTERDRPRLPTDYSSHYDWSATPDMNELSTDPSFVPPTRTIAPKTAPATSATYTYTTDNTWEIPAAFNQTIKLRVYGMIDGEEICPTDFIKNVRVYLRPIPTGPVYQVKYPQ